MARTERGVRDAIIGALSTSAMLGSLGLRTSDTILDRPLNNYRSTERGDKLHATIVGSLEKKIRAWSVQVLSEESPRSLNLPIRNYSILVTAYYEPEDVNKMIDHMRLVREAINNLGSTLSSTVGSVNVGSGSTTEPSLVEGNADLPEYVTMGYGLMAFDTGDCLEY